MRGRLFSADSQSTVAANGKRSSSSFALVDGQTMPWQVYADSVRAKSCLDLSFSRKIAGREPCVIVRSAASAVQDSRRWRDLMYKDVRVADFASLYGCNLVEQCRKQP